MLFAGPTSNDDVCGEWDEERDKVSEIVWKQEICWLVSVRLCRWNDVLKEAQQARRCSDKEDGGSDSQLGCLAGDASQVVLRVDA